MLGSDVWESFLTCPSQNLRLMALDAKELNLPRELRRLVKRGIAISSASPFLVSIVATAADWIYKNGVLCYTRHGELRVLDIHGSADQEIVVYIRTLLNTIAEVRGLEDELRPLYYAGNIVSCLYGNWLIVLEPRESRVLTTREVESLDEIFVRNNGRYLYYRTFSDVGRDGNKRWALYGFDITTRKWFDKFPITDIMGSDIGLTTCFEIINDHFYAISSQTIFEIEGHSCASYYNYFRFAVDQPSEESTCRQLWRRQNDEGVIDDRWGFMRLYQDEISGDIMITESRKEHLSGRGAARAYYTTTPHLATMEIAISSKTKNSALGISTPQTTRMLLPSTAQITKAASQCQDGILRMSTWVTTTRSLQC